MLQQVETGTRVKGLGRRWSMLTGTFIWPSAFHAPVTTEMADTLKLKIIDTILAKYQS
jgi:hypothetical protein